MKILLQVLILLIPGAGMLQALIILGMAMLLLKIMVNSFVVCKDLSFLRKGVNEAENLWAIE